MVNNGSLPKKYYPSNILVNIIDKVLSSNCFDCQSILNYSDFVNIKEFLEIGISY